MTRFPAAQKAFERVPRTADTMLTAPLQRCGMAKKKGFKEPSQGEGGRMSEKINDPVALWQKMLGEMEKGFNSIASEALASPQFSKAMNQAGGVTAGAHKQLGDFMEKYLISMNMPSRSQMVGIAERLQTIEGQLGDIKLLLQEMQKQTGAARPMSAAARPPRTRKPPSSGEKT